MDSQQFSAINTVSPSSAKASVAQNSMSTDSLPAPPPGEFKDQLEQHIEQQQALGEKPNEIHPESVENQQNQQLGQDVNGVVTDSLERQEQRLATPSDTAQQTQQDALATADESVLPVQAQLLAKHAMDYHGVLVAGGNMADVSSTATPLGQTPAAAVNGSGGSRLPLSMLMPEQQALTNQGLAPSDLAPPPLNQAALAANGHAAHYSQAVDPRLMLNRLRGAHLPGDSPNSSPGKPQHLPMQIAVPVMNASELLSPAKPSALLDPLSGRLITKGIMGSMDEVLLSQNIILGRQNPQTAVSASLTAQATVASAYAPLPMDTSAASGLMPATLSSMVQAPLQTSQWADQMSEQLSFMYRTGFQQAQIRLNPAHLGPLEIQLAVKDEQASINFVTQHVQVKEALDQAMPRLKELLEQQGINLADVDVSTQSERSFEQANEQAGQQGLAQKNSVQENADTDMQVNTSKMQQQVNYSLNRGLSVFV